MLTPTVLREHVYCRRITPRRLQNKLHRATPLSPCHPARSGPGDSTNFQALSPSFHWSRSAHPAQSRRLMVMAHLQRLFNYDCTVLCHDGDRCELAVHRVSIRLCRRQSRRAMGTRAGTETFHGDKQRSARRWKLDQIYWSKSSSTGPAGRLSSGHLWTNRDWPGATVCPHLCDALQSPLVLGEGKGHSDGLGYSC